LVLALALLLSGFVLLLFLVQGRADPSVALALSPARLVRPLRNLETLVHVVGIVVVLVLSGALFAPRGSTAEQNAAAARPAARRSDEPPDITVESLQLEPDPSSSSERPTFPGAQPQSEFEANPFGAITARPDRPPEDLAPFDVPKNPVPRIHGTSSDDRDEG
jgi:hypothetical protein